MSKLSPKLENWMMLTQVIPVNIIQSYKTFMYIIDLPHNYALFQKTCENKK